MKLLTLAVVAQMAWAAPGDDAPPIRVIRETSGVSQSIVILAPEGHHINIDAPLKLSLDGKSLKKKSAQPARAVFPAPAVSNGDATLEATAYICDDANTFCVKRTATGTMSQTPVAAVTTQSAGRPKTTDEKRSHQSNHGATVARKLGFLYNDGEAALSQAKKTGKPLLIEFFGIWCPPCNVLDNTVFRSKEFKDLKDKFVLVKLDADHPASWQLKEKYRVGGYPTIVFANSDGDEITRVVGSRTTKAFARTMKEVLKPGTQSFSELLKSADDGNPQAAYKAGIIYLERGEFNEAERLLGRSKGKSGHKDHDEKLMSAHIAVLKERIKNSGSGDAKDNVITEMTAAFDSAKDGLFRLQIATDLADLLADSTPGSPTHARHKKYLQESIRIAKAVLKEPLSDDQEWQPQDLWMLVAHNEEELGNNEAAKLASAQAVVEYEERLSELKRQGFSASEDRGYQIELAHALAGSGQNERATKLLDSLEKKYPNEFTFYFNHARILTKQGKFEEALPKAQRAYDHSYGDNRLRSAHVLADIYSALKLKSQGLAVIREALAKVEPPKDPFNRTHRYLRQLKALEQKMNN